MSRGDGLRRRYRVPMVRSRLAQPSNCKVSLNPGDYTTSQSTDEGLALPEYLPDGQQDQGQEALVLFGSAAEPLASFLMDPPTNRREVDGGRR